MVIFWPDGKIFDEQNYCQLLRRRKTSAAEKWFISPDKVIGYSTPETIRPTDKRYRQCIWLDYDYFGFSNIQLDVKRELYFSPLKPKAKVEAIIAKRLTPQPPGCPKDYHFRPMMRGVEEQINKEFGLGLQQDVLF